MTKIGSVTMDFKGDYADILRARLWQEGYKVPASDSPEKICIGFFNVVSRRIEPRPRVVMRSREFSCPSDYVAGLGLLEEKVIRGADLNGHLSRSFRKSYWYRDGLLNEFGVHHLHLGTSVDAAGVVAGTEHLLFARITHSHFYMIDIFGHQDWTNTRAVEILHSNWPDSIRRHRIPGAKGIEVNPSDEDRKALRKEPGTGKDVWIDAMVQVSDGTVYQPMGGGFTLSGMNVQVIMKWNATAYALWDCERSARGCIERMFEAARVGGRPVPSAPVFKLAKENGTWCARDSGSRFMVMFPFLRLD